MPLTDTIIAAIHVRQSLNLGQHLGLSDSDAQILYFAGALLLTAILVGVTIWYARLTKGMVNEMRRQQRPYVYIAGEVDLKQPLPFSLMLRNNGIRVAQDVRLIIEQDAYIWRFSDRQAGEPVELLPSQRARVSTIPFLTRPIVSLAPGESRYLGSVKPKEFVSGEDQMLTYIITYRDGAEVSYEERFSLPYKA